VKKGDRQYLLLRMSAPSQRPQRISRLTAHGSTQAS
jgi:hypothetical protein